jgi:hypothetical protein
MRLFSILLRGNVFVSHWVYVRTLQMNGVDAHNVITHLNIKKQRIWGLYLPDYFTSG